MLYKFRSVPAVVVSAGGVFAALSRPSLPSGYRKSGGESKVLRCAGCCAECSFLGHPLRSVCCQPMWARSQTLSCHRHIVKHPRMAFPLWKGSIETRAYNELLPGLSSSHKQRLCPGVLGPYVMLVSSGALCCTETLEMLCICAAVDTHLFFVGCCSLCSLFTVFAEAHLWRESAFVCHCVPCILLAVVALAHPPLLYFAQL